MYLSFVKAIDRKSGKLKTLAVTGLQRFSLSMLVQWNI